MTFDKLDAYVKKEHSDDQRIAEAMRALRVIADEHRTADLRMCREGVATLNWLYDAQERRVLSLIGEHAVQRADATPASTSDDDNSRTSSRDDDVPADDFGDDDIPF